MRRTRDAPYRPGFLDFLDPLTRARATGEGEGGSESPD